MHPSVYLMRHGCTVMDNEGRSDGWLDLPLSDAGRMGLIPPQQRLKMVPLKTIHTSALKRTEETGHIVSTGTMSNPPVKSSKSGNTWDLGVLTGMKKYYGHPKVEALLKNPDTAPMGGESYNHFKGRFMPWFRRLIAKATPGHPILYVGSGSNLRCISKELLGDDKALDLDEGCLVALRKDGGKWHAEILSGGELSDTIRMALVS